MDTLVEQEYSFNIYSARYGHFLVDVYTAYPEVLVRKAGPSIKIKVPAETAVLLKLKYGDSLVKPIDQLNTLSDLVGKFNMTYYSDEDSSFNAKEEWFKEQDDY